MFPKVKRCRNGFVIERLISEGSPTLHHRVTPNLKGLILTKLLEKYTNNR